MRSSASPYHCLALHPHLDLRKAHGAGGDSSTHNEFLLIKRNQKFVLGKYKCKSNNKNFVQWINSYLLKKLIHMSRVSCGTAAKAASNSSSNMLGLGVPALQFLDEDDGV